MHRFYQQNKGLMLSYIEPGTGPGNPTMMRAASVQALRENLVRDVGGATGPRSAWRAFRQRPLDWMLVLPGISGARRGRDVVNAAVLGMLIQHEKKNSGSVKGSVRTSTLEFHQEQVSVAWARLRSKTTRLRQKEERLSRAVSAGIADPKRSILMTREAIKSRTRAMQRLAQISETLGDSAFVAVTRLLEPSSMASGK